MFASLPLLTKKETMTRKLEGKSDRMQKGRKEATEGSGTRGLKTLFRAGFNLIL
jgi:hypothetical protein